MTEERLGRTLLVAATVALLCSLMVSAAVIYLRPVQLAWAKIERNRVILELAGLVEAAEPGSDREVAVRFRDLDVLLIDLERGQPDKSRDALSYDPLDPLTLAADGIAIPDSLDIARLGQRSRYAPVYLRLDDGAASHVILPLHGQGMWAPIHGFIALEGDCNTVVGIAIHEHAETPGIGDQIHSRQWRDSWVGKQAFDPGGRVMLAAIGSGHLAADQEAAHGFDAISGATVTVNSVSNMVAYWLGGHGFGPFLADCRSGGVRLP